jgi:type IV pilus assembly protein PilV
MLKSDTPSKGIAPDQRGSVLLEGLIAILIFSFGILGLIGLQAASMKSTTLAKERVDASLIANQRIARMWVNRGAAGANLSSFAGTLTAGSTSSDPDWTQLSTLPNGTLTTAVAADVVTVTVGWQMPGQPTANSFVAIARINGN